MKERSLSKARMAALLSQPLTKSIGSWILSET